MLVLVLNRTKDPGTCAFSGTWPTIFFRDAWHCSQSAIYNLKLKVLDRTCESLFLFFIILSIHMICLYIFQYLRLALDLLQLHLYSHKAPSYQLVSLRFHGHLPLRPALVSLVVFSWLPLKQYSLLAPSPFAFSFLSATSLVHLLLSACYLLSTWCQSHHLHV